MRAGDVRSASSSRRAAYVAFDTGAADWKAVAARCPNTERATRCIEVFAKRLPGLDPGLETLAKVLVAAAGTGRDSRMTEGLITPLQGVRARDAMSLAPPALRAVVDGLLKKAASDNERAVILKGLAARRERLSDPAAQTELKKLATLIRGHDREWLIDKTTGLAAVDEHGLRQAWTTSCVPTVKLVAEAEVDPLLALRVMLDPRSMNAADSFAGKTERKTLEAFGGVARPRPIPENAAVMKLHEFRTGRGSGTKMVEVVPRFWDELGGKTTRYGEDRLDDKLVGKIAEHLRDGYDVPMRIGYRNGLKVGHAILAVDCHVDGGVASFRLYNPATGKTAWVKETDLFSSPVFATKNGDRFISDVYLRRFEEPSR